LFRTGPTLSKEQFLLELEKYQLVGSPGSASQLNLAEPIIYQRWEPRLSVSQPIEVWGQDYQESPPQTTSLIDVSHRGARVGANTMGPTQTGMTTGVSGRAVGGNVRASGGVRAGGGVSAGGGGPGR